MTASAEHRHWQSVPAPISTAAQKDWLTRPGSLTQHLRDLGHVEVRVLRERGALAWPDEAACVVRHAGVPVWLRDIVMSVDGVPFVTAHSIAPLADSHGVWQAIRRLQTRPLAELLFWDREVSRSPLVSRWVGRRHPMARQAVGVLGEISGDTSYGARPLGFWARRSVFERHARPLLVTECMLPALWERVEG